MKIEVLSSGHFVEVPNIANYREALRVGAKMFQYTLESVLPLFPVQYHNRALRVFAEKYKKNLNAGKPPFQCVKNANAELKQKAAALSNALKGWLLPLNALYSTEIRESEKQRLLLSARRIADDCGGEAIEVYRHVSALFIKSGIKPPKLSQEDELSGEMSKVMPAVNRLLCAEWINKKVEMSARLHRENVAIAWGEVNKKNPYISASGLKAYRAAVAAGEQFLSSVLLVNDTTEETMILKDAAEKSASNARIREIELNVRVDGLTEWAERNESEQWFLTCTAPSVYHYNKGSQWLGTLPTDTQKYMVNVWAKVRARLAKAKISYRGFRVVEPHKDATPHWHMLIFFAPCESEQAREIIRAGFCEAYADELDTEKKRRARFDAVKLQNAKHAARYVAKYISKNLDGKTMENGAKHSDQFDDETGLDIASAAERVRAWASFHSIRQFQFFGVGSITIFREIRRLRVEKASEEVQRLIEVTGGTKDDEKKPNWYEFERCNVAVEFIKTDAATRYGEETKKIKGLLINGARFITRIGQWMQEELTPAREAALKTGGSPFTWKVVNNCNPLVNGQPRRISEGLLMPIGGGNYKLRTEGITPP